MRDFPFFQNWERQKRDICFSFRKLTFNRSEAKSQAAYEQHHIEYPRYPENPPLHIDSIPPNKVRLRASKKSLA